MSPETYVKAFTHLKDRPKAAQASTMLQRIASLVKPIMRKHSWVLPVLAEFFPDDPSLVGLNVNGGQKILLRLRPPHSPDSFYEEEQVVHVMLHELTHNVHGPHDDKFYKFLAGLEQEYDALKRSGYAGEGFFSDGKRLGANVSHNLPPHLARAKALEAAEKRRKAGQLMGSGGRLGGSKVTGLSPRELAAWAAERRARDNKACASGAEAEHEAEKAAKESVESQVIDLTGDDEDDSVIIIEPEPSTASSSKAAIPRPKGTTRLEHPSPHIAGVRRSSEAELLPNSVPPTAVPEPSTSNSRAKVQNPSKGPQEWACPTCTLLNPPAALQCDACLTTRPEAGWTCLVCGESPIPHDFWTCRFCGTMKLQS